VAKVTKREKFENVLAVLEVVGAEAEAEFVKGELALLEKRANAVKGKTKVQLENEVLKAEVLEVLAEQGALRATAVGNAVEVKVQRATALLRQLVTEGAVVREVEGKVVTFRLAE